MRLAEVHELVEAVGRLDPACRDRGVLAEVVASSARLRAWLAGCQAQAKQLSEAESISEVIAPDGTCDLRWATIFVQSYLLHYYDGGLDVEAAVAKANQAPDLVPMTIWRDGIKIAVG